MKSLQNHGQCILSVYIRLYLFHIIIYCIESYYNMHIIYCIKCCDDGVRIQCEV